jgi:nucleoporin SEH1
MGQVLGSIGEDLRLKIWKEDPSQVRRGGRRFSLIFSQSSGHSVVYSSLDFVNLRHETYLAVITRDGLLGLLEPVNPERFDDWNEIDQVLVCGDHISRGVETSFKVAFQHTERPNRSMISAGFDKTTLSIAVTAMTDVKIYRLGKTGHSGEGQYKIQYPLAELTGADGLVRDVAWSQETFRVHDWIATASADGYVRIYELWMPKDIESSFQQNPSAMNKINPAGAVTMSKAAPRAPSGIGAGLASASLTDSPTTPSQMYIRHEWKLVEKIKHEGVWRVEWVRGSQ